MEQANFEKLRVYQDAIAFVAWWAQVSQKIPGRPAVKDQLDRASTSMPLNIAEGNGRYSLKERSHYFTIACFTASYECYPGSSRRRLTGWRTRFSTTGTARGSTMASGVRGTRDPRLGEPSRGPGPDIVLRSRFRSRFRGPSGNDRGCFR